MNIITHVVFKLCLIHFLSLSHLEYLHKIFSLVRGLTQTSNKSIFGKMCLPEKSGRIRKPQKTAKPHDIFQIQHELTNKFQFSFQLPNVAYSSKAYITSKFNIFGDRSKAACNMLRFIHKNNDTDRFFDKKYRILTY